jgi:hypothetical protein
VKKLTTEKHDLYVTSNIINVTKYKLSILWVSLVALTMETENVKKEIRKGTYSPVN